MTYLEAVEIFNTLAPLHPVTPEQHALFCEAAEILDAALPPVDERDDDEWVVGRNGTAYDTFRI